MTKEKASKISDDQLKELMKSAVKVMKNRVSQAEEIVRMNQMEDRFGVSHLATWTPASYDELLASVDFLERTVFSEEDKKRYGELKRYFVDHKQDILDRWYSEGGYHYH